MKKFSVFLMGLIMLCACVLPACSGGQGDGPNDVEKNPPVVQPEEGKLVTDEASLQFALEGLYPKGEAKDEANGFSAVSDLTGAKFNINGEYVDSFTELGSKRDVRIELYNGTSVRLIHAGTGMAFTLPVKEVSVDYSLAKYRTQYFFDDSVLTYSSEYQNPYPGASGWVTYLNEWLFRHLLNPALYANQNLTLLNELDFTVTPVGADGTSDRIHEYPTAKSGNLTRRPGYDIYRFDIKIEDSEGIERPYYNIGAVREVKDYKNFGLFVMKSQENKADLMDSLVMSWTNFSVKGIVRNNFDAGKPLENPRWNEETRAYFRQLMTEDKKNWGVFSYSMPGEQTSLHPGQGDYDAYLNKSIEMQKYIEETVWGRKYDIYMTYTHLGWTAQSRHYFPSDMAKALAGGNGDGTRPTLEFTFQYTTNNNGVAEEISPMFDIMRGRYDEYFNRLAQDIKAYRAPVMLRLNNEMNTDWTSYSGILNLLDPDIFVMTWRRLYDIFEENDVDNVIWIWNPIADSCPYSGWGADLCYFPGREYAQLLGGTSYEMNNYADHAETNMKTFSKHYGDLYAKNKDYFDEWVMIIGEFACGSGGNADASAGMELGRNGAAQAEWIKGMFDELYAENPAPYAKQIKGLIWFNCNDYEYNDRGELTGIINRLQFADPHGGYEDLKLTYEAFRNGFLKANGK